MKKLSSLALCLTYFAVSVQSSAAANVNVVHGIDGRDLGLSRDLPVDIAINGTCSLKGVTFKQSALVELSPATYVVTVHLADGSCSQDPVINKQITIPDDGSRSFSAVANLSPSGVPKLNVFNNSRDLVLPASVTVRHAAKAGSLYVKYSSRELTKSQTTRIKNGGAASLLVLTDKLQYTANVQTSRFGGRISRLSGVGSKRFTIHNVVGSKANGFTIITERLAP